MTLPPALTSKSLAYALNTVQNYAAQAKDRATSAVATMAAGNVDTTFVFSLLDGLNGLIANLNAVKNTAGLDAYAAVQVPGYAGTMSSDITATVSAAQACIDWVVANFPKDNTATFLLAQSLNADGSRTMRSFSSAQTAGFRTALNSLLVTIG
jgi:hypothetical protein